MSITTNVVSAGDVLQLCQQSWKLQHTFQSDRLEVPAEFTEVEVELDALTKSLRAASELLDEDQTLLLASNLASRSAAITILESCQRTLHELEILVSAYQDVKRVTQSDGSRRIERQWRPIFLRNYLTMIWTNEGGDIHDLKDILALHTDSMNLFYTAITSNDLKLLEYVMPSVAQNMQQIHVSFDGTEKAKIMEIGEDLDIIARRVKAAAPPASRTNNQIIDPMPPTFLSYGANISKKRADASREWLTVTSPEEPPAVPPRSISRELPQSSSRLMARRSPSLRSASSNSQLPFNTTNPLLTSPPLQVPGPLRARSNTATTNSSNSYSLSDQRTNVGTVDSISHNLDRIELASNRSRSARAPSSDGIFTASVLPTSAGSITSPHVEDPFAQIRMLGKTPPGESSSGDSTETETHKFWRNTLFKHAAVLFDRKCSMVEYTIPNEKRQGDWVMETACGPCQAYLITKGLKSAVGIVRYHTSIWILSDDGETVIEQKLPDDADIIPYTIWDNHTKIVLRVSAELRFYNKHADERPKRIATTSWINYVFEDESAATEFQNVLLGKKLLISIRTRKTTRLHAGVKGAFAHQQQLCALENLRIFRDDNTGLVYGMIHFVPEFSTGNGYMTFALNDTKHPIRVKEDSATTVRIKGMTIGIREGTRRPSTSSDPTRASKKGTDVLITGAKLEFYSRDDKALFMIKLKEIQDAP